MSLSLKTFLLALQTRLEKIDKMSEVLFPPLHPKYHYKRVEEGNLLSSSVPQLTGIHCVDL